MVVSYQRMSSELVPYHGDSHGEIAEAYEYDRLYIVNYVSSDNVTSTLLRY